MKPVVLVHGMYSGGWCWRKVLAPLRAAGHTVLAPSLTGCAERAHLSCDGMAVARAAELQPERVGRLVLVDALIPFSGKSAADASLERMHAEFPLEGRLLDELRTTFPRAPMFESADLRRSWRRSSPSGARRA